MVEILFAGLAGVVVGFILSLIPPWVARRRKLKSHWHAIRAELIRCKEKAETLKATTVKAPTYRLPVVTFNTSFPVLLSEGDLTEDQALKIGKCFDHIQELNCGLDYAAELDKTRQAAERDRESKRNCAKAKELLDSEGGKPSLYDDAKAIVDAKINRR